MRRARALSERAAAAADGQTDRRRTHGPRPASPGSRRPEEGPSPCRPAPAELGASEDVRAEEGASHRGPQGAGREEQGAGLREPSRRGGGGVSELRGRSEGVKVGGGGERGSCRPPGPERRRPQGQPVLGGRALRSSPGSAHLWPRSGVPGPWAPGCGSTRGRGGVKFSVRGGGTAWGAPAGQGLRAYLRWDSCERVGAAGSRLHPPPPKPGWKRRRGPGMNEGCRAGLRARGLAGAGAARRGPLFRAAAAA